MDSELCTLKGIKNKRLAALNGMGIFTVKDLLYHFPSYYLDLRNKRQIKDCYHNEFALVCAKFEILPHMLHSSKNVRYVKAMCSQNGEPFSVLWFNQPYVLNKFNLSEEYLLYGRIQNKFGAVALVNPTFESLADNKRLKGIIPVYGGLKEDLTQKILKDAVLEACEKYKIDSIIPRNLIEKHKLAPLSGAFCEIHNPQDLTEKSKAAKRIAVEEYFAYITALRFIKGNNKSARVNNYTTTSADIRKFCEKLPFALTAGQKKAVNEIYENLKSGYVMNRLLQGDVGCGKTVVAIISAFMSVNSGYQAAFLSPTEVLAAQTYQVLCQYFDGNEVCYLSGSVGVKQKKALKEKIKSGEIKIICGTHAIIQGDVEFNNLAFCVCDEQHRFGVVQRSVLQAKGDFPDVLVMSATPIPRTLSLVLFGDLEISTIKDKPQRKAEVQTNIIPSDKKLEMIRFIEKEIKAGRQAYFVCPKIDEDEEGEIISVKDLYNELTSASKMKFAIIHGRMKDKDKQEIMRQFKDNEINCLISTTVIEVGIDVANASIMVIYSSERFGLTQLHQLRGRIGRGDYKSYCFLLSDNLNEKAEQRLQIIRRTNDGFKISEYDFELRGSGDFLGTRQHGKMLKTIEKLQYGTDVIFLAKQISEEALADDKNSDVLFRLAREKYDQLKDITLN